MKTKGAVKIAFLGVMLAVMIVLSAVEHALPPLPFFPVGVKFGLGNIVVMYCVFFVGNREAVTLNALKSAFVFLMRGPVAGLLSFCGGMLSIAVIILLVCLFKDKISVAAVSVAGAIAHNVGQFAAVSVLMQSALLLYYLPMLVIGGVLAGVATGVLLKVTLPLFDRVLK